MPNVQVAIRCRPALPSEATVPCTKIECNEYNNTLSVQTSDNQGKTFTFDRVIPESSTQDDVFDFVSPMVDHALDGLHSTIFAYGQTGSGKTHTMEGMRYVKDSNGKLRPDLSTPTSQHGILPRVIESAFHRANDRMKHNPNIRYKLKCSFMQLYNERITDLLNPSRKDGKEGLRLRWTRNDQFAVENLFVFECADAEQMREMFQSGVQEKVMGTHAMNTQSSRSHCLFTIFIQSWDPDSPDCIVKSELTLVDLAGSEKLALLSANPSAQLLKESIEINSSLLSLGKVITALSLKQKTHIPYRDSKLTKLLKHALGGNSMTLMIACINPLDTYVDESVSTLLYAGRARNITNTPHVNEDPRSALIRQLREEITMLKAELDYYRQLANNGTVDPAALKNIELLQSKRPASTSPGASPIPKGKEIPRPSSQPVRALDPNDPENNALAEKLIESCEMVKNLMKLNGQLRSAYDRVSADKQESERKEVELNAENTNLRERIEMLESIALNEAAQENYGGVRASSDGYDPAPTSVSVKAAAPRSSKPSKSGPTYGEKLSAYNKKYRNPQKSANYEEFYGVAKRPVQERQSASSHIVSELERLTRNMPKTTTSMIPQSLRTTNDFGSLAYGGADVGDLEERRRQRELKRAQLQNQHNTMQRGFSGFLQNDSNGSLLAGPQAQPVPPPTGSSVRASGSHPPGLFASSYTQGTAGSQQQPTLSSLMQQGAPLRPSSRGAAPPSPGTHSGRLFNYLSQADAKSSFTPDQLEKLSTRRTVGGGLATNSSGSGSSHGRNPSVDAAVRQQQFQRQLEEAQRSLMNHRR